MSYFPLLLSLLLKAPNHRTVHDSKIRSEAFWTFCLFNKFRNKSDIRNYWSVKIGHIEMVVNISLYLFININYSSLLWLMGYVLKVECKFKMAGVMKCSACSRNPRKMCYLSNVYCYVDAGIIYPLSRLLHMTVICCEYVRDSFFLKCARKCSLFLWTKNT